MRWVSVVSELGGPRDKGVDTGKQVFILAVTEDSSLVTWSRDRGVKESWKGSLNKEDLGGDLQLGFMTVHS